MYMGHLGIALAAKRGQAQVPLLLWALAAILLDLVDAAMGLLHLPDRHLQWSHSLPAALVWALVAALALAARFGARAGALGGAVALSHLPADWVTSSIRAWPEGPHVGLHLYASHPLDLAAETAVIAAGWALYRSGLTAQARRDWPAWAVLALLLGVQVVFDALPLVH